MSKQKQKKDFEEILNDYVNRSITVIEKNPAIDWIHLCNDLVSLLNINDTNEMKKRKNKNKNEAFVKFVDEVSDLIIFLKILKKLKKIILNYEEYKTGKNFQKFLEIGESLKEIEKYYTKS